GAGPSQSGRRAGRRGPTLGRRPPPTKRAKTYRRVASYKGASGGATGGGNIGYRGVCAQATLRLGSPAAIEADRSVNGSEAPAVAGQVYHVGTEAARVAGIGNAPEILGPEPPVARVPRTMRGL